MLSDLFEAKSLADCPDENIGLPDCPCGVFVADRIAGVIGEEAQALNFVEGAMLTTTRQVGREGMGAKTRQLDVRDTAAFEGKR
jgi:hypothetical protein